MRQIPSRQTNERTASRNLMKRSRILSENFPRAACIRGEVSGEGSDASFRPVNKMLRNHSFQINVVVRKIGAHLHGR